MRQKPVAAQCNRLWFVQLGLLGGVVLLSPVVAGRLTNSRVPEIIMQVLVLLSAMVWVTRIRHQGSVELPSRSLLVLTAVLILLGAASSVRSVSVHDSLLDLVALICYATILLMVGGLRSNRPSVYGVVGLLLISAIIVGTIGIKERLLTTLPDWRVFSTFFNPDFLAGFMALVLPVALAWYLSDNSVGISAVAGLAVVLSLSNLLLSGSRFGALAAVGGLIVFLILALISRSVRRPQLVRAVVILVPCVIAILLTGATLTNRMASVKAESHSGGFRIHTWKGTARMVRAHPVTGTGLGTFEVAYPKYAEVGWTRLAHNSYLQLAAEGGVALPVVLVGLIGVAVVPAVVGLRRRRDEDAPSDWMPNRSLMMCGLLGGASASLARNFVDSDWYVAAIGTSFWLVIGAVTALSDGDTWQVRMPAWKVWAKVTSLGVIVLGLLSVLIAQGYYAGGWALLGSGDRESGIRAFRRAITHDPLDPELHRKLGAVLCIISEQSDDENLAKDSEQALKSAAHLEPTAPKTWYQLGKLYANCFHDDKRAVAAYLAALDRDPHALQVLVALAGTYERMHRNTDALEIYRRMTEIEDSVYERIKAIPEIVEPSYIFAREALGRDAESRGDKAWAGKQYRLALDRIERYEISVEEMGPVMEQMGTRDTDLEERIESLKGRIESRLTVL